MRAYNFAIAVEAARAGLDEIEFDYVPFPTGRACATRGRARVRAGIDAIGAFLAEARSALAPYNVFVAADIFGYVCWNLDDTCRFSRITAPAEGALPCCSREWEQDFPGRETFRIQGPAIIAGTRLAGDEGMAFMMLETGAAVLTLLIGWEMRRQRRPWQSVVVFSLISFAVLTAMIIAWRGL